MASTIAAMPVPTVTQMAKAANITVAAAAKVLKTPPAKVFSAGLTLIFPVSTKNLWERQPEIDGRNRVSANALG